MSQSHDAYSIPVIDRDQPPITSTNSSIFVSKGTQAPTAYTDSSIFVSEDTLTTITCAEKDRLIVQLIRANQELQTALARANTETVELANRSRTLEARVDELQAMLKRDPEGSEFIQNARWDFSPVDWDE